MKARMIRIDDAEWEALEEIGKQEDRSASYLVRQAIKYFLEAKAQENQPQSKGKRLRSTGT